jgi:hypothetical protein
MLLLSVFALSVVWGIAALVCMCLWPECDH